MMVLILILGVNLIEGSGEVFAQSIKTLKEKEKKLKNQMSSIDKKLSATQKSAKQGLQELERLNADIEYRDMLIDRRSREILGFTHQIDSLNRSISALSEKYDIKRKKYADMIYYAYITKSQQDKFLYILASKSFQEGYRRFQYLSSLAELRKQQSITLSKTRQDIQAKRDKVNLLKEKTEGLLKEQEKEKEYALFQKNEKSKLVASLRSKEKELKEELRRQQVAADNLNKKIQDMVAKQAAAAAERARKQAAQKKKTTTQSKTTTTTSKTTSSYALSNEESVIAGGFEKNKGLLPWPVKGVITGKFGNQPHPVLKDVVVNNKGVYITASVQGAKALSVYNGVVSQCFSVPGGNNAVIVRHGNYLTVYANLTQIYVKNGQKITKGTPIGKIYQETNSKTVLFFQVWKEKTLLNPQLWLKK
jgi:septal ring factor EnvC (AmiA/AmiB activator)